MQQLRSVSEFLNNSVHLKVKEGRKWKIWNLSSERKANIKC